MWRDAQIVEATRHAPGTFVPTGNLAPGLTIGSMATSMATEAWFNHPDRGLSLAPPARHRPPRRDRSAALGDRRVVLGDHGVVVRLARVRGRASPDRPRSGWHD
jgi:hypothetical protein